MRIQIWNCQQTNGRQGLCYLPPYSSSLKKKIFFVATFPPQNIFSRCFFPAFLRAIISHWPTHIPVSFYDSLISGPSFSHATYSLTMKIETVSSLECQYLSIKTHSITSQKTKVITITAVRTLNHTSYVLCMKALHVCQSCIVSLNTLQTSYLII
jgi:hypothetical protein